MPLLRRSRSASPPAPSGRQQTPPRKPPLRPMSARSRSCPSPRALLDCGSGIAAAVPPPALVRSPESPASALFFRRCGSSFDGDESDPESPPGSVAPSPAKAKRRRRPIRALGGGPASPAAATTLVLFLAALVGAGLYARYSSLIRTLDDLLLERDDLSEAHFAVSLELKQASENNARVHSDYVRLIRRKVVLDQEADGLRDEVERMRETLETERNARRELESELHRQTVKGGGEREKALEEVRTGALEGLKEAIQRNSRREVLEKYGPGPYRVEFHLSIPSMPSTTRYFSVEMAPLHLMPHSVRTFLRQISAGAWDGSEIFRNREHILVARAVNHETGKDMRELLREVGAEHLDFREWSGEYPHERYTLGLVGDPGGPNFYINKLDNTQYHDGGDDVDGGDPCFARIVSGQVLVDKISALPTNKEDMSLVQPVVIQKADVLVRRDGNWMSHK